MILRAAGEPELAAFDIEGEAGDGVGVHLQTHEPAHGLDHRDHQGRGRAQARAGRAVGVGNHGQRDGDAAGVVGHEAVIDALQQAQRLVGRQRRVGRRLPRLIAIGRHQQHLIIVALLDADVGEQVDGCVQDHAAILVAIGRDVGPAAAKAQPQGGASAHQFVTHSRLVGPWARFPKSGGVSGRRLDWQP